MLSYCCSFSDFLQSHYTVLLSSFLLPFYFLTLLFTSLYFSDPSGSKLYFLSSLLLLHISKLSAVTQGFFFWRCVPRIPLAVSVPVVLKVVIIESMSVSSLFMMVRGANFPPIIAWGFPTHWDLSAFRGQTWVLCVWACWFFSGEGGRLSSAIHDHFQCLLLENFMFWHCSLLVGRVSSLQCNQSGCGLVHLGYTRSIIWMLFDDLVS